jgi:hypothetical protein
MTPSILGTICAAVRDSSGNLVMEATLETKAETILESSLDLVWRRSGGSSGALVRG